MPRLKHRRIDRLLQAHAVMYEPQEYREYPLLLLVAAGRAERQIWRAIARDQRGRERDARTRARSQGRGVALFEPANLAARRNRKAETRHHRRSLQPAA